LRCLETSYLFDDLPDPVSGALPLFRPGSTTSAFLRTEYDDPRFSVTDDEGLFRYRNWLPVKTVFPGSGAPVAYRSEGFARAAAVDNLIIVFSGYWPERGALMPTGTFKETEAYSVFGRRGDTTDTPLVIASAGNTARAFLHVATRFSLPLVVVVPEKNLDEIWTPEERSANTLVIAVGENGDYTDAIRVAAALSSSDRFEPEGGARNVARRDGMSTTYLAAVDRFDELPRHYVQAVGSGTGAISAWEANLRLIVDGRFGSTRTRLHLAQNTPFQLLVDSWASRKRDLAELTEKEAKRRIAEIDAHVLANRTPPWSVTGGLFDALTDTNGEMYAVSNVEAREAARLFRDTEGIDVSPAASIACAALMKGVKNGTIPADEPILLNVTGGGYANVRREFSCPRVRPDIVVGRTVDDPKALVDLVESRAASTVN
jgi:cysteate synthase